MKMKIGGRWIVGMAVLCLVAIWILTRHETENAPDSASTDDRGAIHSTRLSKGPADGAEHQRPNVNLTMGGPAGGPDTSQSDVIEQGMESHAVRDTKKAEMSGSVGRVENTPGQTTMPAATSPPLGVQLAPDVRLPVAALPIDFETNEVTARMLDLIVSDYYSDLAAGVSQDEEGAQTTRILEENGETTILVENGPVAEAARQRADWRFRTIFGKEAYNRMSMQSNLEARLPVTSSANGDE